MFDQSINPIKKAKKETSQNKTKRTLRPNNQLWQLVRLACNMY